MWDREENSKFKTIGSCVLKASTVKCWLIPLINLQSTLDRYLEQHMIDIWIDTHSALGWHSINILTESRGFTKLKSKFSIDDVETKKAFSLIRSCICETVKILNDILLTNSHLAKIGLIQSNLCTFCNTDVETIDHFFFTVFTHVHFAKNLNLIGLLQPKNKGNLS